MVTDTSCDGPAFLTQAAICTLSLRVGEFARPSNGRHQALGRNVATAKSPECRCQPEITLSDVVDFYFAGLRRSWQEAKLRHLVKSIRNPPVLDDFPFSKRQTSITVIANDLPVGGCPMNPLLSVPRPLSVSRPLPRLQRCP